MGGPTLFSDGIRHFLKPDNPTGAGKCRCFVLLNGRGALPSPLAMLLVQIRANFGHTSNEPRRQDRYRGTAQSAKGLNNTIRYRPVSYSALLRCSTYTNERKRTRWRYTELHQVGVRNVSFGTVCNYTTPFSQQQSMLDRMNPGTTPQKAIIGGLGAVVDIDTWETAGDINRSYQRGDYLQCCGDSRM
ncbi:hypothetical protein PCH_Pc17g00250 [Penicillium rubens Wisconsin 54-1255]|uniref:Uncharacterized protein n=1 Tax=Penicillium rubens (strain ATCC 28089 / DSM 1075 / NRRL 1951 / Wisconsin 54-1255) TaxID=500485 RepID=B6HAV7_PENRW|nr:hypothetical protein PCH_Pc17g00250 [Penicillium rubens Wisconsin 54-1255]